jgi:hypothetical protein
MEESRRSERWMKLKGVQAHGGAHQRMAVGGGNSSNDDISSEGATRMRERAKGERGDDRGLKKGITSSKMEGGLVQCRAAWCMRSVATVTRLRRGRAASSDAVREWSQ